MRPLRITMAAGLLLALSGVAQAAANALDDLGRAHWWPPVWMDPTQHRRGFIKRYCPRRGDGDRKAVDVHDARRRDSTVRQADFSSAGQ